MGKDVDITIEEAWSHFAVGLDLIKSYHGLDVTVSFLFNAMAFVTIETLGRKQALELFEEYIYLTEQEQLNSEKSESWDGPTLSVIKPDPEGS